MKTRKALALMLTLVMLLGMAQTAAFAQREPVTTWAELKTALNAGGEIQLQSNVTAAATDNMLTVPKSVSVTLDLNGYMIDRALQSPVKKGSVFEVNGELTVTDTSAAGTGTITGGNTDGTGGGVWVRAGGSFTLAGGAVSGNNAKNVGGGVYLAGTGSKFTMTGGSVSGNSAKNGGGLGMDGSGTASLSGGTISDNTASNNGGGVWFGSGTTFHLSGGSVTGNTASALGGGIYINDGSFDYSGGSVLNNTQSKGSDIAAKSGQYELTFDITVNSSGDGTLTADKAKAAEGETVTLTATPGSEDVLLKDLTVTAGDTAIPTEEQPDGTRTFTMPSSAVTVSAAFRELHRIDTYVSVYNDPYAVTATTLTTDKDRATEGEIVTATLQLEPGYEYMTSDVNYTIPTTRINDTTFTFVMPDEDAEVAVYLQKAEFTVSLGGAASADVMFTLNNEPKDFAPFPANYGDWVNVIFYPQEQLISAMTYTYTENGKTVTNSISFDWNFSGGLEGSFRMPNSDVTVRVEYNQIHNITENWTNMANGIIASDVTKAAAGTEVTVFASPDELYTFSGWHFTPNVTLTSDTTAANGNRVATFTMPDEDVSFYATFELEVYDIAVELPDGHGTITAANRGKFEETVSFTVTPADGYAVKSVQALSDGTPLALAQDGDVYSFLMPPANVTLRAEFEAGKTWEDLGSLLFAGGEVTLTQDYTASGEDGMFKIPEGFTTTLDLNGYKLNGNALQETDVIEVSGTFKLKDSVGGGKIMSRDIDDVIYVFSGLFEMTGGTVESIQNDYGCVYIGSGATFRLAGGSLCGSADYTMVSNLDTFEMTGGTVTGSCIDTVCNNGATMMMAGGSISGSIGSAEEYGFGIYLEDSDLFLSGSVDIDVTERPETLEGVTDNYDAADFDIGVNMSSMIYVTGALDLQGPQVGVRKMHGVFARGGAYADGEEDYVLTQSDVDCFKSTHPAYGVRLTSGNKAELAYVYNVNIADGIENGTVSASASTAFEDDYVELTLEPAEGYVVESVTVNGTAIQPDANDQYGFYMPAEDVTVSATFIVYVDPDEAAADAVEALIGAIGEVAYTAESKAKIDDAREAYDDLTDAQKALVENYATLTAAEARYAELKAAAEQAADQAAADAVEALIADIGEVAYTDESKAKIDDARDAYDDLTDAQKALVENYDTLTAAETSYAELKTAAEQAAADQAAADAVEALIDAIGEVAYTDESKAKIDDAREAYNALTEAQKALVENYDTLTAAETSYAEQKTAAEQAAADQAAADAVKALIGAIGEVAYTAESNALIDAAREAYDALTDAQKALVENYATLTAAEARYAELEAAAQIIDDPDHPDNPTNPDNPATGSCPLCGNDHTGNNGIRIFHYVLYWLIRLFRDWLPGLFK